ncbi:hypothetical protein BIY31_11480 [Gibbsiella quercinecans]|nr:hypothetical protein BIY31_11480 [Gibbsiella quercinecans]
MQVNCKSEIKDQSIIDLLPVEPHMAMLVLQLWANFRFRYSRRNPAMNDFVPEANTANIKVYLSMGSWSLYQTST